MRKAFVIVDMQNGFMNQETSYLEEKTAEFLKQAAHDPAHPAFDLIIGTRYVNHTLTACYQFEGWKDCMEGSTEAQFCEKLLPYISDEEGKKLLISKDKYTCYTEDFLRILRAHKIDRIYFCGVNTGCCVFHSALDTYENLIDTYVIRDLCGSTTGKHYHEIAIELLGTLITKDRIITSEEFLAEAEWERLVKVADEMAEKAHAGQKDKSGADYITHPRKVAAGVKTPEEKCVALLHDTLEDTYLTEADLRPVFGDRITDAVLLLTHDDEEPYFDYVRRISQNPLAAAVKKSDLCHNMDLSRLSDITEKDIKRYKKYREALKILEKTDKDS